MEALSGQLDTPPTAVSWGPDRVDVFGRVPGTNTPSQWTWNGSGWAAPVRLPAGGANLHPVGVSAVALAPNRLDVFANGADFTPWWWRWNGSSWALPQKLVSP